MISPTWRSISSFGMPAFSAVDIERRNMASTARLTWVCWSGNGADRVAASAPTVGGCAVDE